MMQFECGTRILRVIPRAGRPCHFAPESPTMYRPNFCAQCGERLASSDWRARIRRCARASWCDDCARRLGRFGLAGFARPLAIISLIAISAFAFGRYLRPAPPPLIISRAANSPLSDLPVNFNDTARKTNLKQGDSRSEDVTGLDREDAAYICGARTKKGTPCRRRVHAAGERCFQHKGMPAMVPLEKLEVKSK